MGSVDLHGQGISSFVGIGEVARLQPTSLDLSRNQLWSFEGFGTHDGLERLDVGDNPELRTFLGLTRQRRLQEVRLEGAPLANQAHYRIMALLTVGFSLRVIDGRTVGREEVDLARKLGPNAALAVSCGWMLDLAPRDERDYQAIIHEQRSVRRQLLAKHAARSGTRSVLDALSGDKPSSSDGTLLVAKTNNRHACHPPAPVSPSDVPNDRAMVPHIGGISKASRPEGPSSSTGAAEVELLRRTVAHLSRRVSSLEGDLREARGEAQELRAAQVMASRGGGSHPFFPTTTSAAADASSTTTTDLVGLSPSEISASSSISFANVTAQSNLQADGIAVGGRVHVTLSHACVEVADAFRRQTLLLQRPWHRVLEATADVGQRSVRLGFADGLWVRLTCASSESTFAALWKTVHFRWGRLPPPLPGAVALETVARPTPPPPTTTTSPPEHESGQQRPHPVTEPAASTSAARLQSPFPTQEESAPPPVLPQQDTHQDTEEEEEEEEEDEESVDDRKKKNAVPIITPPPPPAPPTTDVQEARDRAGGGGGEEATSTKGPIGELGKTTAPRSVDEEEEDEEEEEQPQHRASTEGRSPVAAPAGPPSASVVQPPPSQQQALSRSSPPPPQPEQQRSVAEEAKKKPPTTSSRLRKFQISSSDEDDDNDGAAPPPAAFLRRRQQQQQQQRIRDSDSDSDG